MAVTAEEAAGHIRDLLRTHGLRYSRPREAILELFEDKNVILNTPTGSGKSALAMQVAAQLPVEIISVDSAQVYRGMDIGTAKPTPAERQAVPHHLIDIRDPEQAYSAGEFRADALRLLDKDRRVKLVTDTQALEEGEDDDTTEAEEG